MSKADWTFLELLLEQGHEYPTGVGQVWLTVLFLFRVLVLSTAAESVWGDEQSDFVCNTLQPGCEAVCYDKAFPISHYRFFILQVIAVASPAIFYISYATLHASWQRKREEQEEGRDAEAEKKEREKGTEREGAGPVRRGPQKRPRLRGRLLGVYLSVTVLKLLLEGAFVLTLWHVYGFTVPAHYVCQRWPCPNTVDCFVSRPMEKTVFTVYMQTTAGVSLVLNLLELCVVLRRCGCHRNGSRPCGCHGNGSRPCGCRRNGSRPCGCHGNGFHPSPRPAGGPPERANLHLPAGKGRGPPGWEAGIGWGVQHGFGVEPVLFSSPPYLPRVPQGAPRGSRAAPWHYHWGHQQGGASL